MKVFKEEQRFTQTWLMVLLTISVCIPVIIMINEYLKHDSSFNTKQFASTLIAIIISVSFIFLFKLKTRIDENGIHYQFFPFHLKSKLTKWNEIENVYVRKYEPITEYGGWGFHKSFFSKQKGTAINVSGNIGIQLELKNGKKLLIGTQKENEAKQVLQTYKNKLS